MMLKCLFSVMIPASLALRLLSLLGRTPRLLIMAFATTAVNFMASALTALALASTAVMMTTMKSCRNATTVL